MAFALNNTILLRCVRTSGLVEDEGYYVAYKPITLLFILFIFIEIKFIYFPSNVMFAMKFMNICNDKVNYDEIII